MFSQASFKDYFSTDSESYRKYRPGYPLALFSCLAEIAPGRQCAWDCATGSGQSATALANNFDQVIATDASESQIARAMQKPGISYRVASAEHSQLESSSVDLITVSQALHWFSLAEFSREVERVLKPGGVLAVWTYKLLQINEDVDALVRHLYGEVLGEYWPPERKMVEQGYANVSFPFEIVQLPTFEMTANWSLPQLFGYLQTWSALKQYQEQQDQTQLRQELDDQQDRDENPLEAFAGSLIQAWGDAETIRSISWPLSLRVWRK